MERRPQLCFESWANELAAKSQRIRDLIGDRHWLSDGHHKESLVRTHLRQYLPVAFEVSRGFICPPSTEDIVSPEIDILITRPDIEPLWFKESEITIAPPKCCIAQIHVKTEFDTDEILSVFESSIRTHKAFTSVVTAHDLWSSAIFFSETKIKKQQDYANRIISAIKKLGTIPGLNLSPTSLPNAISIIGGPFIRILPGENSCSIRVIIYNTKNLSFAVFFSHLFDHISTVSELRLREGDLVNFLSGMQYQIIVDKEIPLEPKR